ncbi:S-layer homology domain-containing protein [Veillonella parvula]|uniref:S-layer homology domain-containing protein n=1 Tax=Veillonella parvula TaxID=29466 RepID=UPI0028E58E0D|nr:S-layer homology domain-containing protein [Veillonella parvula]
MKHKQLWLTAAVMTMLGTNMSFAAVQIGDNSIAEGNQAIATGVNSIAVGTNAVATGDNLTGSVIKQKLAENQAKLAEIERLTKLVNDETIDFNQKHAIYNRVEAAKKKIAENNALIQNILQPNLDTATNNYNAFKPEYDETVRQMNERLSYINKLNFSLLTTDPNGLDTLATELKQKSEDGFPSVNNDLNFYKTYIQNYIKAKGDLENIKADRISHYYDESYINSNNTSGINTNGTTISGIYYLYNPWSYYLGRVDGTGNELNIDASTINLQAVASLDDTKYNSYLNKINNFDSLKSNIENLPLTGALTQETKNNLLEAVAVAKKRSFSLINLKHEQYLYDSLKNTNPTQALIHLQNKLRFESDYKDSNTKLFNLSHSEFSWENSYNKWFKSNVTDIENSNTLTIKTLSDQYKVAIADKQAKLDDLNAKVQAADVAVKAKQRENAQLQPTQQELDDAAAAARVKAKLDADQAALDDTKRTLALNNLKNIGTNAIAVGNNSLVTGKNAIGIGTNGLITGEDAIGIGRDNTITGVGSVTIGSNNSIQSNNAFAIGNNINIPTGMNNSVVIGNNSTAKAPTTVDGITADATVSIGSSGHERQIVNVAKGEVSSTSTDAINGSQLYKVQADVDKKASTDASNLTSTDASKWQEKLGTGTVTNGNTELVTGDTVYKEIAKTNTALDTKANTGLDNITDAGKTVIRNVAKGAVKVVNGQNTTVTTGTDGDATTYAVNVSSDAIKDAVQPELNKKANTDASNLTGTDVSKWQEKLGTGTVTNGNTGLVTGDTVYKEIVKTNTTLDTKANTGLDNITDAGKTVIRNVAKGAVKVVNGQNTTVTTGTDGDATTYAVNVSSDAIKDAVQPELNKKANTDASNLTGTDVSKWQEKLGTGTVVAGNTGLVTGDTVYNVVKNSAGNPLAVAYDSIAKDHISLNGQNGTIISNVRNGQVAEGSMDAVNGGQLFETNSRLNQLGGEVKHVGAISATLAGLHPQEYDDHYKLSIAVARGAYDGASAFALGAFYRPNSDLMFNAASTISSDKKAYTVGVSYKFGTSTKQSVLAENAALQDKVNKLESMMNTIVNSPLFKLSKERSTFPDVPSERWDAPAVETLHANGIIQGYPDGTFKGDQPMSRSEYAKMIYELAEKLTTPNN